MYVDSVKIGHLALVMERPQLGGGGSEAALRSRRCLGAQRSRVDGLELQPSSSLEFTLLSKSMA